MIIILIEESYFNFCILRHPRSSSVCVSRVVLPLKAVHHWHTNINKRRKVCNMHEIGTWANCIIKGMINFAWSLTIYYYPCMVIKWPLLTTMFLKKAIFYDFSILSKDPDFPFSTNTYVPTTTTTSIKTINIAI